MTTKDVLKKVLKLFSGKGAEKRWTKGEYAAKRPRKAPSALGQFPARTIMPTDLEATCWCLEGAVFKTLGKHPLDESLPVVRAFQKLNIAIYNRTLDENPVFDDIVEFNDSPKTKLEDVRAVVKKAIALCR